MRNAVLVALMLVACAKSEQPAADTTAMTAGPAPLTEADVAGTWSGTMKPEGSDSVAVHWTQVCGTGSCRGTAQEMPDTVKSTYTIAADSVVGKTGAYADPTMGGVKVVDNWVLRVTAPGQIGGRGWYVLADKPDSVVFRYTFEGARK